MKKIECEALISNLDKVTSFVEDELESLGCGKKQLMQITLAAEEIYVNIAHYAYGKSDGAGGVVPDSGSGPMSLSMWGDNGLVTLIFEDIGVPYNPLEKEDPDISADVDDRQIGGLGIFMAKKSMDNMRYEYRDGRNILTLEKRIGVNGGVSMLNIRGGKNGENLLIQLEGRLDTTTASQLEEKLNSEIDGVKELTFDLKNLDYISSAGLRILLSAQKTMNNQGKMIVKNASEEVQEIFEVTGFSDIFIIQ
ncbi:anti-anti-sigma factor [Pseudobutyrivibrio sp. NOR37]|nr:anti-sigma factor antagonist [Pseudobutyrivibrio sp. NOR37]SFR61410.1 anti-anti-sigma factor [Pseudobutyrivibrio sp. NOR37]